MYLNKLSTIPKQHIRKINTIILQNVLHANQKHQLISSQTQFTKVGKININYEVSGAQRKIALCLPCSMGCAETDFLPQINSLGNSKLKVLFWDPPGYGKSIPLPRYFSTNSFKDDEKIVLESMKINMGSESNADEEKVIKVRGLPWSATKSDIIKFFDGITIKNEGIHMTLSRKGRPSGEAYIELENEEDLPKAEKKHNEHMGTRYIEVFEAKRSEIEWVIKKSNADPAHEDECCVRLRGLPFECSKEEIMQFFSGLEIVPNGIVLPTDFQGRHTGEAYVQFVNEDTTEKAMEKHKKKIAHRYIEIFKSNLNDFGGGGMNMKGNFGGRGGASNNGGQSMGHCVHMKGLPFRAAEFEIAEFFSPLNPVCVRIQMNNSNRPSGYADVEFATHDDAVKAMNKDREHMQHRYIELFLNSTPNSGMGGNGTMGGG